MALTITEQFCGAVQPEQTPDVLELTEQEPPQSETTSYEKEVVPQLLVGSTQVMVNVDTLTSVTITFVGGGSGPVHGG